jgi:hypothetical protein
VRIDEARQLLMIRGAAPWFQRDGSRRQASSSRKRSELMQVELLNDRVWQRPVDVPDTVFGREYNES